MEAMFLKVLNMSITASWLILAVIALRFLLKRAPKWQICALWALVAIRLLLPFSIESAFSLIPSAEPVKKSEIADREAVGVLNAATLGDREENIASNRVGYNADKGAEISKPQNVPETEPEWSWTFAGSILWIAGTATLFAYMCISYLRIRRKTSISLRLHRQVYMCDEIETPFILGILKPRIYIPSALDKMQRKFVLAHEQAHLQRLDHLWKFLGFFILAVHWFNPLCWLAYGLFSRDVEFACDEKVVGGYKLEEKKAYSMALLTLSVPQKNLLACPLAFGEVGVKRRVKGVLHYKKPSFWIILVTFVTCVLVAVCFLTNPAKEEKEKPAVFVNEEALLVRDMTYGEFKDRYGREAELYHADFYTAPLGDGTGEVVFRAKKFDEEQAMMVLENTDSCLRLQGELGSFVEGLSDEVTVEEFAKSLVWKNGLDAEAALLEGAGTAYYVADRYVRIRFDSDGENEYDAVLEIALSQSDKVEPASYTWLYWSQDVVEQGNPEAQEEAFTFADVAGLEFYFSSGAGGWRTVLHIREDGSFDGLFTDSDMGITGEDYPKGTISYSEFTGRFSKPRKVNDTTYAFQIESIEYPLGMGEAIKDGYFYDYVTAYGLYGAETLYIYLPGTRLSDLPEGYRGWVGYYDLEAVEETELPFYGLYNVEEQCGFSSYQMLSAAEQIQIRISETEEAAAKLEEQLEAAVTQADMNVISGEIYTEWDNTLNFIWEILKENLPEEEMDQLLNEQRSWIAEKEAAAQEAAAEFEGGSITALVVNSRTAELTKERVYELAQYLQ